MPVIAKKDKKNLLQELSKITELPTIAINLQLSFLFITRLMMAFLLLSFILIEVQLVLTTGGLTILTLGYDVWLALQSPHVCSSNKHDLAVLLFEDFSSGAAVAHNMLQ
ncbi:hypothetical protein ACJX0J_032920, partial [Zea mays]